MDKLNNWLRPFSPFCTLKCGSVPILSDIGAVASPLAGVFGAESSAQSAENINAANIRMQRETNEQNYKMFHESQDFQREMFNKANAYNSPEQIAERLRKVGVNPLKVLSGEGSNMQTAGLSSSPSAPTLQAPKITENPASIRSQGIQRAIDSYFQNMNQSEDVKAKKLELLYQSMDFENRLEKSLLEKEKLLADKNISKATKDKIQSEIDIDRENLDVLRSTRSERIKSYGLQNDYLVAQNNLVKAQESLTRSQDRISRLNEKLIPEQHRQQIKESESRIVTSYMQARAAGLSASAAMKSAKASYLNALKTDGIRMNTAEREQYIQKKLQLMESEFQRNMRQGKSWFKQAVDMTTDMDNAFTGQGYNYPGFAPVDKGNQLLPGVSQDSDGTIRW